MTSNSIESLWIDILGKNEKSFLFIQFIDPLIIRNIYIKLLKSVFFFSGDDAMLALTESKEDILLQNLNIVKMKRS